MTVPTTTARVAYTGNGVSVAFTVPFKFLTNADIAAYVNGVLQPTGVTITGAGGDTGIATFATAPANLATVVLVRAQINDQQTDLPANGPFPAQSVETMADKAMIGIQQLQDGVDRSLKLPITEAGTSALTFLPADRAGKFLAFDALKNPVGSSGTGTDSGLRADLAASTGSSLVAFRQPGTGAVARSLQAKLGEMVSVEDYGAVGDGVTNDAAAFQAASNYLASIGGGTLRASRRYLIDSNLTIGRGVSLAGSWLQPGELLAAPQGNYGALQSVLLINSAATISFADGAGIRGFVVMRKGLTLPFADAAAASAGIAAFAGTALSAGGQDVYFGHLLILGFNKAIYSTNNERVACEYIRGDNKNGIEIDACFDIAYVRECHFWPYTTAHFSWASSTLNFRSGIAFNFQSVADATKLANCFAHGYVRGFTVNNVNTLTLAGCTAESYTGTTSCGFEISGTSQENILSHCQADGCDNGIFINAVATGFNELVGCMVWACGNGVLVGSGDVTMIGGAVRGSSGAGVSVASTTSRVFIDAVRFSTNIGGNINFAVANSTTFLGLLNDYIDVAAGGTPIGNPTNAPCRSFASASPNLLANGVLFNVTGTTNFGALSGGWVNREVTLVFSGVLTVGSGTGATNAIRLNGSVSFTTAAGSTLTLVHNGVQWYEKSRSA